MIDGTRIISLNAHVLIRCLRSYAVFLVALGFFLKGCIDLHAQNTTGAPINVNVGDINASFVSSLIIDDQSLGNSAFVYRWHYSNPMESDGITPLTGDDLVSAIVSGTTGTQYALNPITEGVGIDSGVDGFHIGNMTSVVVSLYDPTATNAWTYWINGGSQTASYSPYQSISPTNWTIALDTPFDRILTNNSMDGWTLSGWDSNYTPTGAAPLSSANSVPEPSTFPLALVMLPILVAIARWKQKSKVPLG